MCSTRNQAKNKDQLILARRLPVSLLVISVPEDFDQIEDPVDHLLDGVD